MAVHTNDAVPLHTIFVSWEILREFTYEDVEILVETFTF